MTQKEKIKLIQGLLPYTWKTKRMIKGVLWLYPEHQSRMLLAALNVLGFQQDEGAWFLRLEDDPDISRPKQKTKRNKK